MARTNYATIINTLSPATLTALGSGTDLQTLVLTVINADLSRYKQVVTPRDPIFPSESIKNTEISLTFGEWLSAVVPSSSVREQTDRLTLAQYPTDTHPEDDPTELESLGGFGSKTDKGKGGRRRPIFEFRKYLKVPIDHLPQVIDSIWELIVQANAAKK